LRYLIDISYKGKAYAGFQVQKNAITVQQKINEALTTILREDISTTGASRTDTGVHAKQNFVHFDFNKHLPKEFLKRLNIFLPKDISVNAIYHVPDDFHARFDGRERSYEYLIYFKKNPFEIENGWFYPFPLDVKKMNDCASLLKKYIDFSAFTKKHTQVKTNDCTIKKAKWIFDKKNNQLLFEITANRFLRGMVKALVGTMVQVGRGKISVADFKKIIESKNARLADFSPPPQGLYLTAIKYKRTKRILVS
jgi:tRNA pseudouridine38-40 synthase